MFGLILFSSQNIISCFLKSLSIFFWISFNSVEGLLIDLVPPLFLGIVKDVYKFSILLTYKIYVIFLEGILITLERSSNVVIFSKVSIFLFPPQKKRTCGYSLRSLDCHLTVQYANRNNKYPHLFCQNLRNTS